MIDQWAPTMEVGSEKTDKDYILTKLSEEVGSDWWQLSEKAELNTKETGSSLCST